MNVSPQRSISHYKTIAILNEDHKIFMVQHQESNKIYVKKTLAIYNRSVYEALSTNPVNGTPKIIDLYEEKNQLTIIEDYISGQTL